MFNADGKVRAPFSERSTMTSIFSVGHVSLASREYDVEAYAHQPVYRNALLAPLIAKARAKEDKDAANAKKNGGATPLSASAARASAAARGDGRDESGVVVTADAALDALGGGPTTYGLISYARRLRYVPPRD